jgi:hypothetical protein
MRGTALSILSLLDRSSNNNEEETHMISLSSPR